MAALKYILGLILAIFLSGFEPSVSTAQSSKMGELIEGQWAEGQAFDPFGRRPIQLWLPEGTLIYNIEPSDRGGSNKWKYRFAETYHGYPVNLKLQPSQSKFKYRKLDSAKYSARFRLNRSVFCPGETSPIVWPSRKCLHRQATGEGWTFEFSRGAIDEDSPVQFNVRARPNEETLRLLRSPESLYAFVMFERDMDLLEKKGVLFRLDRRHPVTQFEFVGNHYFPCNTEQTLTLTKKGVEKAFSKASVEAGFNIWGWLKATVEGGVAIEDERSEVSIERTKLASSESSIFRLWGVMSDNSAQVSRQVPFFIEKEFECKQGAPTTDPGERILSVKVEFWNDQEDWNDTYEFNDVKDWATIDEDIYDKQQRPVFLSINSSEEQAQVLDRIMMVHEDLHFNQAVFIFAQLNNGCSSKDRKACRKLVTVAPVP